MAVSEAGTVWAIDIGNNSLKALYLSTERGVVEVIGFDNIRHGKILSGEGVTEAEREELVALSLRKFVNKYDLSMDDIVVSVPSQNSFARFVTLPPVEEKRIPEMVKFEAVQQIPFGINDVQWDWQLMSEPDSSEIKIGIFAIKNEVVNAALEHFNREDVQVGYVQMAPMALYNYLLHDRPDLVASDSQATVVINVGADNTDLVVCTKSGVWQRCILIGGNAFTQAIADAFRLNFEKAEKLKRTAPVSKYARQIFQAMRPVFTDLASEVQRSLGFYNNSNPNTKITKVIALGGGTKLRGLTKYLQQTLQIPVERPDTFKRLVIGSGVSPAKFHENVSDFGIVYGLALQGLGLARIESNLLPRTIARSMAWANKNKYFIAAACLLLAASLLCFGRTGWDRMNYNKNGPLRGSTGRILSNVQNIRNQIDDEKNKGLDHENKINKVFGLFDYREMIPHLYEVIISALPNEKNNPQQARLYRAFGNGDVEGVLEFPRKQRKQIFISNMSVFFSNDLGTAQFGGAEMWRSTRGMEGGEEQDYAMLEGYSMMEGMDPRTAAMYGITMETPEEKMPGFVVEIAGFSPYEKVGELLDPPKVEDQKDKWGFVTRLAHLDDLIVDGNSPFEVFKKTEPDHFKLEIHPVELNTITRIPGIGVPEYRTKPHTVGSGDEEGEWILIDPMTKEIISQAEMWDENGQRVISRGQPVVALHDRWFTLNMKFVWRDAPESVKKEIPQPTSRGRGRSRGRSR